jgi:uncharacterized membrane protein
MKNNKFVYNKIYISLAMLIILGISFVSAFSVSYPYMENKTLNIPLNSKVTDLEFVLQNGGGATENVNIRVNILEGSEIINITNEDNVYAVSPGDKIPVNLRITLPDDAMVGSTYNIHLEFTTVSLGSSGEFSIGTGQEQDFKVVVGNKFVAEKTPFVFSKVLVWLIIGILLLILIIAMFLSRKKKKNYKK